MTLVLYGFGLIAAYAGYGLYREWVRRNYVRDIAAAKSWTFVESDSGLAFRWRGWPFVRHSQSAVNVLRGTWGGERFTAFDLIHESTKLRFERRFGVIVIRLPAPLPWLAITAGRGGRAAGLPAEDAGSEREQFNRTFQVDCPDDHFAEAVLHPRMVDLLLNRCEISLQIRDECLLGWHRGTFGQAELERHLNLLCRIIDLIPPPVWHEYRTDLGDES